MSVKILLQEELESQIKSLDQLAFGSDEHKIAVDGIAKLTAQLNDMERLEYESKEKTEARKAENELKRKELDEKSESYKVENNLKQRELTEKCETYKAENELKQKELDESKMDHIVKNVMTAVNIGVGFGLTVWATKASLKFEETGTFTTSAGRKFINTALDYFKKK